MRITPKYLLLIGLLCAGLTTLARATVTDLGEHDLHDNGDATELQGFIDAGGDPDAVLVLRVSSPAPLTSAGLSTLA